jgi:hypothetical protein
LSASSGLSEDKEDEETYSEHSDLWGLEELRVKHGEEPFSTLSAYPTTKETRLWTVSMYAQPPLRTSSVLSPESPDSLLPFPPWTELHG